MWLGWVVALLWACPAAHGVLYSNVVANPDFESPHVSANTGVSPGSTWGSWTQLSASSATTPFTQQLFCMKLAKVIFKEDQSGTWHFDLNVKSCLGRISRMFHMYMFF